MTRPKATAIGFIAVLLWALLALLTVGSAPTPPLLLNAICFTIGGILGLIWTAASGQLGQLRRVSWKVRLWHCRAVWLPRAVFLGPAIGPSGRGRADSLSLAAADCAVFRVAARRDPASGASDWRRSGVCRGGHHHCRWRYWVPNAVPARLWAGVTLCADLGGVFSDLTSGGIRADQFGCSVLLRYCRGFVGAAFRDRRHGLANWCPWLVVHPVAGVGPGGAGVLCLGYWRQTGRHSNAGHQFIRGTAVVDTGFGHCWNCGPILGAGSGGGTDHPGRSYCCSGQHIPIPARGIRLGGLREPVVLHRWSGGAHQAPTHITLGQFGRR